MKRKALFVGAILTLVIPLFVFADSDNNNLENEKLPKITIEQDDNNKADNQTNKENNNNEGDVVEKQTEEQLRNDCPYCEQGAMSRGHRHGMMHRHNGSEELSHCRWGENGGRPIHRWNGEDKYENKQQSQKMHYNQRGVQGSYYWNRTN